MRHDLEGAKLLGQLGAPTRYAGREGGPEAGLQDPRHREMASEFRQRLKAAYP